MKKGIFCQPKQKLVLDPQKAKDYMFVGFDPGQARPCSLCALDGSQVPQDWNSSERVEVLDKSLQSNEFITNDEYNDKIGTTHIFTTISTKVHQGAFLIL